MEKLMQEHSNSSKEELKMNAVYFTLNKTTKHETMSD